MKLNDAILAAGLSTAILTACGSSQNGTPVTVSQSRMHGASGSSGLIYATFGCGGTCVLSYPDGKLVGSLNVGDAGACADSSGNVYIADKNNLLEFSHGGSTPIKTYSVPDGVVNACAIDSMTGDIATIIFENTKYVYNLAIFALSTSTPTTYTVPTGAEYCGYDNHGNLFIDGYAEQGDQFNLYELPSGSGSFMQITVNPQIEERPGQVQWDGKYLAITAPGVRYGLTAYSLKLSGSNATVVHTIRFKGVTRTALQSWLTGNRIFVPYGTRGAGPRKTKVGVWEYPKGGKAIQSFGHFTKNPDFQAVTFSPGS